MILGKYSELTYELINKLSPYELKVTKKDVFPVKIYNSDFLEDALNLFEISQSIKKSLMRLFKDRTFRKAFMYLFWVFVGLKFKNRSFGDLDHFNGTDETTKNMKIKNRRKLYGLMEEDIQVG